MRQSFDLERLRALSIERVAERLGLRVDRHRCLCPFHDDHQPSLSFHIRRNSYHCFVCDAHGGVIDLTMGVLRYSFAEACRWLADAHNILPITEQPTLSPSRTPAFDAQRYERFFARPFIHREASRFLYEERRIDPRVVRWCRLTSWCDKEGYPWLQIPYYDLDQRLMGVQWRNLSGSIPNGQPRFRFPKGSRCLLYNLPVLRRLQAGDALWITEGCSDCWAMLSAGHKAIAIPSATLLGQASGKLLRDSLRALLGKQLPTLCLHMYPDADIPGEKLYLQLVRLANEIGVGIQRHSLPQGCKDFGDHWKSLNSKLSSLNSKLSTIN